MEHSLLAYIKGSVLFIVVMACSACSMLTKIDDNANRRFEVSAYWVQDTLASQNNKFRKINRMSPVVYKNSIVIGNAFDGLVAYDLKNKNTKWRIPIELGVEASAARMNNILFTGSNNGKMYAINLDTGDIIWVFDTKSELVSEPLIEDGVLYFISGSQSLYALDASTGRQIWNHNRQDTSSVLTIRGGSKPLIVNTIIYVGFSDGSLVALNVKTGTELWEITLNRNSKFRDIDATPVIDGDYLYINSYDDKIYCISKNKGEIIWSAPYGGASTPLIILDKIFVTSSQGEIAALSKKDGTLIWKKKSRNGVFTDPANYYDLIVVGESQGKLTFLKQDSGKVLGEFEPGRGVFSKPTIFNDSIFFISGEGNIYGVKAAYQSKSFIYYLK